MANPSVVQLKPFLQPFPYGREGMNSWAAQFALATPSLKAGIDKEGGIKASQPYGELWMGTHENGPAYLEGSEETLKALIQRDPTFYLGKKLAADEQMSSQYPAELPYLFKILSFDKPLPLQCHPDKGLGKRLYEEEKRREGKNSDFVDTNAKPEVGVALSPFTAMVGFRPVEQLAAIIKGVPEFQELFQESTLAKLYSTAASSSQSSDESKAVLRTLFYESINASPSTFKPLVLRLADRISKEGAERVFAAANAFTPEGRANASHESEAAAMARVFDIANKTYGEEDVGSIVAVALMNILRLEKGEGAWILADDLHAYVEGDIIECMANSDNMVAHGLGESEMGGLSTFVEMLSYRHLPADQLLLDYEIDWSQSRKGRTRHYKVPIAEFDLLATSLTADKPVETLSALDGPLTFIVTSGSVTISAGGDRVSLTKGQVGFVRAGVDVELQGDGEVWGAFYQ